MKLRIGDNTYDILNVIDLGQLQTGEKRIQITLHVKADDVSEMMGVFSCLPDKLRIEEDDTFTLIRELVGYTKAYNFQYNSESEVLSVIIQEPSSLDKIEQTDSELTQVRGIVEANDKRLTMIETQVANLESQFAIFTKKD